MTRHMEYGPPGYGEDPDHDAKELFWYLELDVPVCVNGRKENSPEMAGDKEEVLRTCPVGVRTVISAGPRTGSSCQSGPNVTRSGTTVATGQCPPCNEHGRSS